LLGRSNFAKLIRKEGATYQRLAVYTLGYNIAQQELAALSTDFFNTRIATTESVTCDTERCDVAEGLLREPRYISATPRQALEWRAGARRDAWFWATSSPAINGPGLVRRWRHAAGRESRPPTVLEADTTEPASTTAVLRSVSSA
jgi:hypothetical protein